MGRRLPKSRKHKKLKFVDPCYKGPGPCSKKKKLLYNEPPTNEDDQEVPNGMQEIIDFKMKVKQNKVKRKKRKKNYKDDFIIVKNNIIDSNEPGMEKAVKTIPKIMKQRKTENESQFINRLQKMADTALAEAKVEEKYNIELVSIDKDGNARYKSEAKETSDAKKEKRKKYREKVQETKKLKIDDGDFELKKEDIKFGEVVSAPPILTAKPRMAPEINKAGEKKLALKSYLGESDERKKILNTKWKDLTLDKRKDMENERARAVQMYRLLKNKKSLL